MQQTGFILPSGYRLIFHEDINSTNTEALRLAAQGEDSGLWVWAARQSAGKGRAGRDWVSPPGNLFASLLLRPRVPLATVLQLSLVAGIAAHDALTGLVREQGRQLDIRLKWPNDILLGEAKLGGILLESASGVAGAAEPAVVIGTGVNLAYAPDNLDRPVASLAGAGCPVAPDAAFAALAWATAEWIARWQNGIGFDIIRAAWAERAQPVGQPISVNLGTGRISGTFLGIDEAGALRLSLASGEERRILAGDVLIGAGA